MIDHGLNGADLQPVTKVRFDINQKDRQPVGFLYEGQRATDTLIQWEREIGWRKGRRKLSNRFGWVSANPSLAGTVPQACA